MHRHLDIVGRSSVISPVLIHALEDLGKRTFHKCGSRADDTHDPHPEDRARSSEADRCSDADDISRTDAGCGRDHESLKRGYRLLSGRRLKDQSAGFPKQSQLYKTGPDRKIETSRGHNDNQDRCVQKVIDRFKYLGYHPFSSSLNIGPSARIRSDADSAAAHASHSCFPFAGVIRLRFFDSSGIRHQAAPCCPHDMCGLFHCLCDLLPS